MTSSLTKKKKMGQLQIVPENEFVKDLYSEVCVAHGKDSSFSFSQGKIPRHAHSPQQLVLCAHLRGITYVHAGSVCGG